jgi:alpha-1,6-mannosyltransferase
VRDAQDVPVVGFYHSDLPRLIERRLGAVASRGARRYLARLYSQCDLVLAPSRLMVAQLADIGISAVHQPLGIDSTIFRPSGGVCSLRDKLNLAPDTRLLVYAGRFTAEKKLELLIDAVKLLGAPYHLLLIGAGKHIAPDPTLSRMPFCRDQRALARLLSGCDVLVHPGDCETFGLIVLEAMACGLPVVATGGAVAELVDERNGQIVLPDSAGSLAEGIAALYERDRDALGAVSRQRAAAYDWQRIMPQLLGRYAPLLAHAPHSAWALTQRPALANLAARHAAD